MKLVLFTGLALSACVAIHAADAPDTKAANPSIAATASTNSADASVLKNDVDKLSYSFGLNMGSNVKANQLEVNVEAILRGINDGLQGKTPLMTPQEIRAVQETARTELRARQEARVKDLKEKNRIEGEAFLAENAKKPGVKKMESGLQYKVLKEGTGPKPKTTDTVAVQYRGTLINGTEFDASSRRGPEPATFGVTQVIKGWTEALTNMTVGSKWEIYVPSFLAYGDLGKQPTIEPSSTLIFDVELVEIKQSPEKPPQPITSDIIKVPSKAELDAGAKIEIIKPEDLAKYTNKNAQAKPATKPNSPAPATTPK